MSDRLRVLLIAGDVSGDLHASAFVRALQRRVPDVDVYGVGGEQLRAAGMHILVDTASIATMGFVETFGTLGRLVRAYRQIVRSLDQDRPDLVVLVDYPEFNLLIAKRAKQRGIPVFYYIGPQVWAWRRGRVRKIRKRVDLMGLVFPFEPDLYNFDGCTVAQFVGHPLLESARATRPPEATRKLYGLSAVKKTLALLPGSREKEFRYLLRPVCEAAGVLAGEGWQAIMALAPHRHPSEVEALLGRRPEFPLVEGDTYNVVAAADLAVVASGTATLETALLGCPMVIVYRMAPFTYWLARRLVRVDRIGMPNIILQRSVFPELIQNEVTGGRIADAVRALAARSADARVALKTIRSRLGEPGAAERAAEMALGLTSKA